MAACPKCGTELKDDYGMTQCPGCGSFSFVDMEGNAFINQEATNAGAVAPEPVKPVAPAAKPASPAKAGQSAVAGSVSVSESVQPSVSQQTPSPADSSSDFNSFNPFEMSPTESVANEAPLENPQDFANPFGESAFDQSSGVQSANGTDTETETLPATENSQGAGGANPFAFEPQPSNEEPPAEYNSKAGIPVLDAPAPEPQGQVLGPAGDPLGLNEFANSEVSSAKDGPLLFRILISGIDSKELRESIREVLEDPRFAWDAAEILGSLTRGELAIGGVPPVKASILVNRIKRYPVKIRWEQYAISQAGPT